MANYTAQDDINFLSNFAKAEHMTYFGESCILVGHDAVEKSKFDIEELFVNSKRKKVLAYDNNSNMILVTPLLEAPFGCSSFDGSKYSMPLSMPTSRNKYTHAEIDLDKVASFKKLLTYMDKQVRTTQEWNQMNNYMPIIRPSTDSTKYPDRLRVKVVTDDNANSFKSVFYNIATGAEMALNDVPKHAACVCALRVTPVWRMPDGRYGYTLELVRADVHVRTGSSHNSPNDAVDSTP
jgi:hypothetical protein